MFLAFVKINNTPGNGTDGVIDFFLKFLGLSFSLFPTNDFNHGTSSCKYKKSQKTVLYNHNYSIFAQEIQSLIRKRGKNLIH